MQASYRGEVGQTGGGAACQQEPLGGEAGRAVHTRTLHFSVHIKVPQAHPGQLRCGPETKE